MTRRCIFFSLAQSEVKGPVGADEIGLLSSILKEIAPFTAVDGALPARLFNQTGRRRGALADCMIAAAAIAADASLATANPKDFERLAAESLRIVRTP